MSGVSETAQKIWENVPNRYEARAWLREHPLVALGGGVAAGFLAARVLSRGHRPKAARRPESPAHALGDSRVFDRASSALWLLPLVELARIGLQAATYYMVATHHDDPSGEA